MARADARANRRDRGIGGGPSLADRYASVRSWTERLASPLSAEDQQVQSMPDVSPTKWHRAHTTWFFETFLLAPSRPGYVEFDPSFGYLFNSYYEAVGARHARPERGLISRPSLEEVVAYRRHVDEAMADWLVEGLPADAAALVELGLHHEQQHQELLLMDIKHVLSVNPTLPAYRSGADPYPSPAPVALEWVPVEGGVVSVGHPDDGFCFDNELPRHDALVGDFDLGSRLVSAGEWLEFMGDRGYDRPELWLSDGWDVVEQRGWRSPDYWHNLDGGWQVFTLDGLRPVTPAEPVCHLSYYEADAFARWAGARLATEHEWELAATDRPLDGNLLESGALHPGPAAGAAGPAQMIGDAWEWTASPYSPYPGFAPAAGAVGEYNGKFMVNQMVLRGGACVTPPGHIRRSYRNFYPPHTRWHFSGVRLARDR